MMKGRALVVDPGVEFRDHLVERLRQYGFEADGAADGEAFWTALNDSRWDVLLLDMLLPDRSGLELCRDLRHSGSVHAGTPVVLLSALDDASDCVLGLEMGADDYLVKPFGIRVLVARLHALLRRAGRSAGAEGGGALPRPSERSCSGTANVLCFGQWRLHTGARRLEASGGAVVPLSAGEYRLLRCFLDHPYQVLSRDQLLEKTAGRRAEVFDRSIDVQISRLRARLCDEGRRAQIIRTMRGDGYMLAVEVTDRPPTRAAEG